MTLLLAHGQKNHPAPHPPRDWAVAFVIGDNAYLGTGESGTSNYLNDFWQYNPTTDSWTEVDSLPASSRELAVGFAIGNKGYVGTGGSGPFNLFDDFWEFTPACEVPTNLITTNISSQSARLKWDAAVGATKYKVQHRETAPGEPWLSRTINASNTALTINNLAPGTTYKWKVKSICGETQSEYAPGVIFTTSVRLSDETVNEIPFEVHPNPLSSVATVSFAVAKDGHASIEVFDLTGRRILLLDEMLDAGKHELIISREQLGEGVCLVKLITGTNTSVIKLIVQ